MGTGLGPESYAIIEQGRIGQILSSKPQDRRAVSKRRRGLAGSKRASGWQKPSWKSRKRNLSRVFDILEEVGRQVNSLKRQAAKARRFTELRTEMVAQLRVALSGRYRLVEREAAKAALDLNAATAEASALATDVDNKEKAAAALLEQSYGIEAQLTEARRLLAERRVEAERVKGKLESQAREISSIDGRLTRGETESQDLDKRFEQQQLELSEYTSRVAELEQKVEESRLALTARTEDRDRAQAALRERERTMEGARQHVLRLLGEASTLKNQLAQTEQFLVGMERDIERITRDEASASADRERLETAKEEFKQRISARQAELQNTIEQRKQVDEELATRRTRTAEARRKLEELRAESSRLRARRDSLEDIIRHRSYTAQSIKRLFTAVEKGQAPFKPLGVLADFLETEPQYEKAAEEFLHEELEFVLVPDWSNAENALAFLKGEAEGRATFVVPPAADAPLAARHVLADAPGLTRLADVLRFSGVLAEVAPEFLPRLARCYLAPDHATAQSMAVAHPELYFLLPDGVCYHGYSVGGGKKTGSGPLGLKRELREISAQFTAKQKEFDKTKSLLDDLELEIGNLTEDLERLRGLQNRQEKDGVALEAEMRKLSDELSRAQSRFQVARNELTRLQNERGRAQERLESTRKQVSEKESARAEQEQALTEARASLEGLQKEVARIGEEHSALRVEQAGLEERRRSDSAARQRIENQIREMAHRKQNLAREMERLGVERTRLLSDNLDLDTRAGVLKEEISGSDALVEKLAAEEVKCRTSLHEADEALKATRQELQTDSDRRSAHELELVRKQAEMKYLDETCRKELTVPVEELATDESLPVLDEVGLVSAEAEVSGASGQDRGAGSRESAAARGVPGGAAALRLPQRAAAGSAGFDSRHREGDSGDRRVAKAASVQRSVRSDQRELPPDVPDAVRRRVGEMRLTDEENVGRVRHRHHGLASRQEAAERAAAVGRREGADGDGAADGDLPVSAESVLHAGRGGCAAG